MTDQDTQQVETVKVRFLENRVVDDHRMGTEDEERYEVGEVADLPPSSAERWLRRRSCELVRAKGKDGEVYNIGGKSEKQNIEVVKTLLSILGKSEDLITFVKDRPGHDLRYAIDNTKIRDELGWEPAYTFETALQATVDWYLANSEWCDRVRSGAYREYYERQYSERT